MIILKVEKLNGKNCLYIIIIFLKPNILPQSYMNIFHFYYVNNKRNTLLSLPLLLDAASYIFNA